MELAAYHPHALGALLALTLVAAGCAAQTPAAKPTPGFTVRVAPDAPVLAGPGASVPLGVQVTPVNGFAGRVSLTLEDHTGAPVPGLSLTPAAIPVKATEPALAAVTLAATSTVQPGKLVLRFTAASGSVSDSAPLVVTISDVAPPPQGGADFDLSMATTLAGTVGGQVPLVYTLTPRQGFRGDVHVAPAANNGVVTGGVADVHLAGASPVAVLATLAVNATAATSQTVTFTATSGSLSHSVDAQVVVTGTPGVTMTVSPRVVEGVPGGQVQVVATANSVDGFKGQVPLTFRSYRDEFQVTPATLYVQPGVQTVQVLTIKISPSVGDNDSVSIGPSMNAPQTYSRVMVLAPRSGAPGIAAGLSPPSQLVTPGQTVHLDLVLASVGGYDGNAQVNLSSVSASLTLPTVPLLAVHPDVPVILPLTVAVAADFSAEWTKVTASVLPLGAGAVQRPDVSAVLDRDPSFVTGSLDLGAAVSDAALADLDGDGQPDLVVAEPAAGKVGVLLGTAGGGFSSPTLVSAGPQPLSLALADVNGDGHLDLVVGDGQNPEVDVCLGAGDGTFGAPTPVPVAAVPAEVSLVDLDGDGHLDLAVAPEGATDLEVYPGAGDGTFAAAPLDLPMVDGPATQVLGVGADAVLPAVVYGLRPGSATGAGVVRAFEDPTGAGIDQSFQLPLPGRLGRAVLAGAPAGSAAQPVILVPEPDAGEVVTIERDPPASPVAGQVIGSAAVGPSPEVATIAALLNGSRLDLIAGDDDGQVHLRLAQPFAPGYFADQALPGVPSPVALFSADLDGDGNADLVVVGAGGKVETLLTR